MVLFSEDDIELVPLVGQEHRSIAKLRPWGHVIGNINVASDSVLVKTRGFHVSDIRYTARTDNISEAVDWLVMKINDEFGDFPNKKSVFSYLWKGKNPDFRANKNIFLDKIDDSLGIVLEYKNSKFHFYHNNYDGFIRKNSSFKFGNYSKNSDICRSPSDFLLFFVDEMTHTRTNFDELYRAIEALGIYYGDMDFVKILELKRVFYFVLSDDDKDLLKGKITVDYQKNDSLENAFRWSLDLEPLEGLPGSKVFRREEVESISLFEALDQAFKQVERFALSALTERDAKDFQEPDKSRQCGSKAEIHGNSDSVQESEPPRSEPMGFKLPMGVPQGIVQSTEEDMETGQSLLVVDSIGSPDEREGKQALKQYGHLAKTPLPLLGGNDYVAINRQLDGEWPWVTEINEEVCGLIALSGHVGKAFFYSAPLLLVGPPGVGKTSWACRLAEAAGTKSHAQCVAGVGDVYAVSGSSRIWHAATPSIVVRAMSLTMCANPVICIDEIDKTPMQNDRNGNVVDTLLPFLEPNSAQKIWDNYLEGHVQAQWVTWILTANSAENLPQPFLDRCRVLPFPSPRPQDFDSLVASGRRAIARQWQCPPDSLPVLSDDSLALLRREFVDSLSPRKLVQHMRTALSRAAQGKPWTPLKDANERKPMGFRVC